jgi:O-glycosyl hydrolase
MAKGKLMNNIYSSIFILIFCSDLFSQTTTITVTPGTTYQTIFGMGGQGTGDSNYLSCLVDNMGITAYRYYMDGGWAGSITEANITGGTLTFSGTTGDISFFQRLKSKGVTNIISTCWSPPACLKTNGSLVGGGSLISGKENSYGKFLAAFVKDFNARTSQTLYALNIQNEPLFAEPYSSGIMDANIYGPNLQAVHAEFALDVAISGTKFFGPEHMGSWSMNTGSSNQDYIDNLLNSPTYGSLLDAYAVHSYLDGITADLGSAAGWDLFYQEVVVKNSKPLWMSETDWSGNATDWNGMMDHHKQIFSALKFGKVSAWIYWGMGTFYNGTTPNAPMYVCKHYMRFIRSGYKQIDVAENDADIAALGFINPATNDITIVAINLSKTKAKTFSFNNFANKPASFDMYRSTAKENCAYVGKFNGNSFDMPVSSVVTLYFNASETGWQWGPSSPANLKITDTTENSISISWSSPGSWILHSPSGNKAISIIGYSVYLNGVKKNGTTPTTNTTWTFAGLTPGTAYTIDVIARDALYNESCLGHLVDTTLSLPVCTAIVPSASDVTTCSGSTATLTATGGINYRWYNSSSGGTLLGSNASYTTPVLYSYATYYLANYNGTCESDRKAVNVNVTSSMSPKISALVNTHFQCNSAPEQLFAIPSGGTFSGDGVELGYFVPSQSKINHINSIYYTYGNAGCSGKDSLHVYVFPCIGLEDGSEKDVKIYPNPSNGIIIIEVNDVKEEISIQILDELGRVIFEDQKSIIGTYTNNLDLSASPAGIYVVKVMMGDRVITTKIIKSQ